MISPHWSFMKDSIAPKPDPDERILTKAWVERGLSLPCSEFFLSVLTTYGLRPHNICPNSYLLLSNFVTLCEGHLGIRPDIHLWQFFSALRKKQRMRWFSRRIQQLKYNTRLICEYTGVDDQLRVTRDTLPADSLKRRIKTVVKVPGASRSRRFLAEEDFRAIIREPLSAEGAEEDPEDNEEEEERAPKKAAPRPAKHPCAKVSGSDAGASGEASAKKAKTVKPPPLDSKKAERERLKLLANAGKGSRPLIPGATNQKAPASRVNTQKHITKYLKHSPIPAAQTPPEIIPVSSERGDGSSSAARRAAPEGPQDKAPEETEVNSQDKAEATAHDAVTFPANFGDPTNLWSTPKAYSHKFFHKLTEAEKWDLEQDLLNSLMANAWGKADVESFEIQIHKKEMCDFFDQLLAKRKEQQALHYELNKNIFLQRRVTLSQAEDIQAGKEKIAELGKQLVEAQGVSSSLATTSSELESLRSAYKDLETRFAEADKKREQAEKKLAEKKSKLLQKEADFVLKRQADSDTLQKLQNEPLGYNEERRNQVPRDDLIRLDGDDCRDLISACRKICYNLNLKDSRTCDINDLIKRMDVLPELVVDLQDISARGAAQMSLAMCLARAPGLDIDLATTGVPPNTDVNALLEACSCYDTRITRQIPHDEFYDKVVLPADELLEAEYAKEREPEARPVGSGDEGQVTWTSSKDKSKDDATSPTEGADDEDEDVVSSPAKEAEEEATQTGDGAGSSPIKEK
ncbi:hypothetical protein QYE76_063569 [Lolium multiflorum]|uniref:Transposase (putative) gypsy type domain-containing protein n=1 Tax=Lolium multiflorum TaxID=4521 RepID=A0AAD8S565_LOLMU|nr:hypothetical protein QYE76_063569 [Lolium multiflorum]